MWQTLDSSRVSCGLARQTSFCGAGILPAMESTRQRGKAQPRLCGTRTRRSHGSTEGTSFEGSFFNRRFAQSGQGPQPKTSCRSTCANPLPLVAQNFVKKTRFWTLAMQRDPETLAKSPLRERIGVRRAEARLWLWPLATLRKSA